MSLSDLIIRDDESRRLGESLATLLRHARARIVFIADRGGQLLAIAGDTGPIDASALASLAAGSVAATGGMANLLGEQDLSMLFHEGERDRIHISMVGRALLVVIFDTRSSLGLVRLAVKKSAGELVPIVESVFGASAGGVQGKAGMPEPLFPEISDEDIDNLFGTL